MLVVVGGHSRNIGKSSIVAGIIRAMPERCWTAIKISLHGGGQAYLLREEIEPNDGDSGRFLAAGARRSFRLRAHAGALRDAMPAIEELIGSSPSTIIESNSVLEFLAPDLYLFVADSRVADWKDSARRFVSRAGALVFTGGSPESESWADVPVRRRITAPAPAYWSEELAAFLRMANSIPDQVSSTEQIL